MKMKKKPIKPKLETANFNITLWDFNENGMDIRGIENYFEKTVRDYLNSCRIEYIRDDITILLKQDWGYDDRCLTLVVLWRESEEAFKKKHAQYLKELKEYERWMEDNRDNLQKAEQDRQKKIRLGKEKKRCALERLLAKLTKELEQ